MQSLATHAEDFWEDRFLSFVRVLRIVSYLCARFLPYVKRYWIRSEDGSKTPV
jgi:hypothetical protein